MSDLVQISAAELKQQRELLALFDRVWNDPEAGEAVRRTAKKHNPAIHIPDDHPVAVKAMTEVAAARAETAALAKAFDEYKTAGETSSAEARLRARLGEVQGKYGLTDEGMAGTIKMMQDRQLADPEAAALLYRESLPKPKPSAASNPIFDTKADLWGTTKKDERWEQLHTDQDAFFAEVVQEVFNEMPVAA